MYHFPLEPELPESQRATATGRTRFEDVCQDGRMTLLGLPPAMGPAVWGSLLADSPVSLQAARTGIIPILSRLVIEGGEGPVSVQHPLEIAGSFQLAHTLDERGQISRLVMNSWVTVLGCVRGSDGADASDGERVLAGRVFGEHVFSRLLAPPEQRRVVRFDQEGLPGVPPDRYEWRRPEALLELSPEGESLEPDGLHPDEMTVVFGLSHTDSNQHVNSLVYPALFEEAALRRFARLGLDTAVLARFVEISYRKPCFAGDRMRIHLHAFRYRDHLGAVGVFVPDRPLGPDNPFRPHCFVRMGFSS